MLKMAILLAPLFFLCVSVAGQELLQIYQNPTPESLKSISHTLGVSVDQGKLNEVSSSILMAENWLRTHVLSRYPSTNITSIVVSSSSLLCEEEDKEILTSVLFAMENVHHSLVRWGLENKISVSVSFTPKCLNQQYLNPLFELLEEIDSSYSLKMRDFFDGTVQTLRVFRPKTSRKLLVSVPSDAALPPLIGVTSPEMQPPVTSAHPPFGHNLPPCNPHHGGGGMVAPPAAAPVASERVWCVAKPSVPAERLQEAMDYACGEGGADCDAISPAGNCYFPDSIVAHASYAFNSYWQRNKNIGGTCGFGGTAMLINSDPSYLHCHFVFA